MQQGVAKADLGLQGVAEGVTQIEQGATAGFALVLGDDLGLHLHRTANRVGQGGRIARQHRGGVGLQPLEKVEVAEHAVFDDLGVARANLAIGQGRQHIEVGEHQTRLVKGADQVLAARGVDGRLAAH